jgi:hypothetical protein
MPSGERTSPQVRRRSSDAGWLCWVAARASQAWDWVDRRQIDAHLISAIVLWGTIKITSWAMHFASEGDRPGIEVAAIIGAVMIPWSALQAAAIKFIFETRTKSFEASR